MRFKRTRLCSNNNNSTNSSSGDSDLCRLEQAGTSYKANHELPAMRDNCCLISRNWLQFVVMLIIWQHTDVSQSHCDTQTSLSSGDNNFNCWKKLFRFEIWPRKKEISLLGADHGHCCSWPLLLRDFAFDTIGCTYIATTRLRDESTMTSALSNTNGIRLMDASVVLAYQSRAV